MSFHSDMIAQLDLNRVEITSLKQQVAMLTGALQGLRLIFTHGGLYLNGQTREQLCRIVDEALAATADDVQAWKQQAFQDGYVMGREDENSQWLEGTAP